jgi:hypothetical protein
VAVEAAVDGDADGFEALIDCNDADAAVFPGSVELCNGADDDCDGEADEDFDRDGDGHFAPGACEGGDDCDDNAAGVFPGAVELPYDALDQDCDGADLVDVDSDGAPFPADCDDSDADVHPGAAEVAKNGKDDDCEAGDEIDGDGDGEGDRHFGGRDCDDGDAAIHPGARDWDNDAVDSDCNGLDGGPSSLADADASVGVRTEGAFVGYDMGMCDLDADGLDDWIVSGWNDNINSGRVGIWYGASSASWVPDMDLTDADTLINGAWHTLFGVQVECADFDGDGWMDLAIESGEINDPGHTLVQPQRFSFFFGVGGPMPGLLASEEADATLILDSGPAEISLRVHIKRIWSGDLNGDGAAELLIDDAVNDELSDVTGSVLVVAGGRRSGIAYLPDSADGQIDPGVSGALTSVAVVGDANEDGTPDLLVGLGYADSPEEVTDTGMAPGRVALASGSLTSTSLDSITWGRGTGWLGDRFGSTVAAADLDHDGAMDWIVAAPGEGGGFGAVHVFLGSPSECDRDMADGGVAGLTDDGLFGATLLPVPDQDGDGHDDLLINEPFGAGLGVGAVWLVSGRLLAGSDGDLGPCTLLSWTGEQHATHPGYALAAGDVDGDGLTDIAIGAPWYRDPRSGYAAGRAYLVRGR